jgi:hypothetical protein
MDNSVQAVVSKSTGCGAMYNGIQAAWKLLSCKLLSICKGFLGWKPPTKFANCIRNLNFYHFHSLCSLAVLEYQLSTITTTNKHKMELSS